MWGKKSKVNNNVPLGTDFLRTRIDQELNKDDAEIDWNFIHDKMDTIMENENWDINWAPDPEQAYAACMARAEGRSPELPSAKPKTPKRRKWLVYIAAAACIAVILAGSVYAGQFGRLQRLSNSMDISLTNKNMTINYTRTDFQTDNRLYQELENAGMEEVLLPDPSFIEEYTAASIELKPSGGNELTSTADIRWEKGSTYIDYMVTAFDLKFSFSYVTTIDYAWHDQITRDDLIFHICRSPGSTTVVYRANNNLYTVTTNLGLQDLLTFLETIH